MNYFKQILAGALLVLVLPALSLEAAAAEQLVPFQSDDDVVVEDCQKPKNKNCKPPGQGGGGGGGSKPKPPKPPKPSES